MTTVVLAVSGHGYGHAVRSAQVAGELLKRGARVLLRSEAPIWLFPQGVQPIDSPGWPIDVGVVQHHGLEFDIDATRDCWRRVGHDFDARASVEAELLRSVRADVLIADVPPLAIVAAHLAGIPSVAVTNFTWDWIYAAWPGFEDIVQQIRSAYAQADLLLRLPLHGTDADAFSAFKRVEDVPLIARTASKPKSAVRAELGVPTAAKLILLSFGGFPARDINLDALAEAAGYTFLLTLPLSRDAHTTAANVVVLREQPADYVSVLAACDALVTKPGYGIVADCLANRVPMLYTDRGPFREYDVLVDALHRLGCARYVPRADVLDGRLASHLDALLDSTCTWSELRLDGASTVAQHVLNLKKQACAVP
ncbi:MAG: hypothetical protein JOZ81_15420 [Chloroflexi bacterium]|nr:hypothetical protein [Chloroflexota bacterium]